MFTVSCFSVSIRTARGHATFVSLRVVSPRLCINSVYRAGRGGEIDFNFLAWDE